MKTALTIVFAATLLQFGQALYLPPPCLDAGPLALAAPGCLPDGGIVPPLPAHNLANAITASISTAVPPLLEAALPLLLKSVLAATSPLLGAPCGSCASPLVLPAPPSCCNSCAAPLMLPAPSCAAPLVLPAPCPAPIVIASLAPCAGGGFYYA